MTRAHRSLWILTVLTILATGLVAQTLASPAGLATHILLAASLMLLAVNATLLARVLRYLTRASDARPSSRVPSGPAQRRSGP